MAELSRLRQATRLIGVSPGRFYRAITNGRLAAAPGGGPGKPTLVSLEALQTFCQSAGLHIPDADTIAERPERAERLERSGRSRDDGTFHEGLTQQLQQAFDAMVAQYLARVVERQSAYIDAFLRDELTHLVNRLLEGVVDQVVERFAERLTGPMERVERSERAERSRPASSLQTPSPPAITPPSKAEVMTRIRTLREAGLSLQQVADLLNTEGVPTLSGKGRWQKGTIGNLIAQGDAAG